MKKRVISAVLCLSMLAGSLCLEPTIQAAKKPRLNKTKVTLRVGKSYKLKVSNYKGKVSWKTSKKTVAVVSSKGKISAKGKGIAKVTARLVRLKRTLSCKVTVRDNSKQMTESPVTAPANQPASDSTNVQNPQPSKEPVPTATQKAEVIVTATPEVSEPTSEPEETQMPNPTDKPIFGPTNKPTDRPAPSPTGKPTATPVAESTDKPTATPIPVPTYTPGATSDPVQGDVTYKLDLDDITPGSVISWIEEADGTVIYNDVDYLLIPLPEKYNAGDTVKVRMYGHAEGSTPRIWISNGAWTACSNQVNPYTFESTVTLQINNDECDSLQIKAASSSEKFTSLTISSVYISKGDIEEESAVVPGEEVTPTATPGPTARPPVYGPTKAPVKIVTAKEAYVETNIPEDFKEYKDDVEYGNFIVNDTYFSNITNSNRSINVALPANYDQNNKYPVVYVLHGIACNKDMFGTSMQNSSIAKIASNLRAQDKAKDMIIVFVNVRVSDTPENDVHSNENYAYYDSIREEIIDNIMPHMKDNYGVAIGRENTAVCGWSMGGREALYIGISKPEIFGFCAGFCPAFGLLPYTNEDVGKSEDGLLTVGDGSEDIITLPEEYINNTYVQVSHGMYDSVVHNEPVRYHNALDSGNVSHVYTEYPAGHSDGVYDPGFYVFASNLFKTVENEEDNPTVTEQPELTATPEPTATLEPTATPEVPEYYSAPYSLTFGSDTVKTSGDGASYVVNDDGSVTISVSKQYQGISFELPDTLEDANFDTVTITYKDAVNVGGGYGCGIWRIPTDKATEDVAAWGGVFADADSGSRVFSSAGNSEANAWKITKCLLFHNEAEHNMTPSAQVTITSLVFSHSKYDSSLPTQTPKPTATPAPTARPQTTPGVTAKPSEDGGFVTENYEYASDYTLGWSNGIVAYQNGTKKSLEDAGVTVYNKESDRPFMAEKLQGWNNAKLILTQPVKYTTSDGKAHDVESMLTNFDFIADPTAIDNSDVDGKLYVYGTTEGFSYEDGTLVNNKYSNHSLTILSTTDMVNWTDEGFMDTQNLTNLPSDAANKVKSGYTGGNTWAPSGLKIDGDGDGKDEFYLFYTNGGSVGYVMADSPTGPWKDPLNKELCGKSLPNCDDCYICFDPGVLADDKGNAYVYFGGLSRTSGRVVKIRFEEGSGEVVIDGEPVRLSTHAFFEDNEINQFNGKYYYSYCSDFSGQSLTKTASICVYVSSDPLNICFDPTQRPEGEELKAFTDEEGVYHHFLGTILDNPSTIYGQVYNNHHHMQSFKGKDFIFYHSTVLNNSIHRDSKCYRNLHVDEITVDAETDDISITPTYEGAEQIENFNPYVDVNGNEKEINATTTSYSAGVCSRRSDARVKAGLSPMVLDEIDTGDWTKLQGVDFEDGAKTFSAMIASETDEAAVEMYVDSPLEADNKVATIMIESTGSQETFKSFTTSLTKTVSGVHDVYFVFRGTDFDVASWSFSKEELAKEHEYVVTISKDNEYASIAPGEVKYSEEDGSVTFDVNGTNGGTGVLFAPAGKNVPFSIADYSKLVIEVSAEAANIPVAVGLFQYESSRFWESGNGLELSNADFRTPETPGEKFTIEYDLDNVNLWQRENDILGVGVKAPWYIGNEGKNSRLTVYSIKFVKADTSGIPELESIKGVSDPVFGNTGTCINYSELANRTKLNYLTTHYSSITLENEMKPDSILSSWNPTFISVEDAKANTADYVIPDNYAESTVPKLNFSTIDKVLKIAKHYGIKVRAHTLVWHAQTPEFFFRQGYDKTAAYVSKEVMDARLEMYIRSVMHHIYTLDDGAYKDVVYTWDVANEYMHNDADKNWSAVYGNRADKLGNKPGYLKKAFQIAHDCLVEYGIDDTVTLVYNDFNTYYDCRDKIIEMINYFNQEGKICDGVGMQSHLGVASPSVESYLETVSAFLNEGFEVQITELDIGIDPNNSSLTYETQADYVSRLMTGLIDIQNTSTKGKITGLTWWGMYDAISWRGGYSSSGNSHPLLFDENMYDPKPAYYAFIEVFK